MARNRFELSVRNEAAVASNFHRFSERALRDLRRIVKTHGELTKELTQLFSPVDTGYMQAHVTTWYGKNGLTFETGWDASDFLGQGKPFYPWFQEFGTVNMRAQPSLMPAYREVRPQFEAEVRAAIQRAIQRGR